MDAGTLSDQEPLTEWQRRGAGGHHRVNVEPKIFDSVGTRDAIRKQCRDRFGRPSCDIEMTLVTSKGSHSLMALLSPEIWTRHSMAQLSHYSGSHNICFPTLRVAGYCTAA